VVQPKKLDAIQLCLVDRYHKDSSSQAAEGLDQLLLGKADEALYQAKQTGRNQIIIKKMAS